MTIDFISFLLAYIMTTLTFVLSFYNSWGKNSGLVAHAHWENKMVDGWNCQGKLTRFYWEGQQCKCKCNAKKEHHNSWL